MLDYTPAELLALDNRSFRDTVRLALREKDIWTALTHESVVDRTRGALEALVASCDDQKDKAVNPTQDWLSRLGALRRIARTKLLSMPTSEAPILSGNKEAQAWRSFAATLAEHLEGDQTFDMEAVQMPFGGMNLQQWLDARRKKASA